MGRGVSERGVLGQHGGGAAVTHPTDCLTVYTTNRAKARFGRANDGGYVLVVDSSVIQYDAFLSGGISGENSFEIACLEYFPDLVCNAFDPNSGPGAHHPRYHFTQEPVGYYGLDAARNALVKLDIERAEWPWLKGITREQLTHIAQFVVELHSPHVPESGWDWEQLSRLADTHLLVHMHGNNWDGIVDIDGVKVPGTMETTWLRRDLVGDEVWPSVMGIPGFLDQANDPSRPDHVIDWAPFVWGK